MQAGMLPVHRFFPRLSVQPHRVTIFVNQLDPLNALRAARRAADLMHEFEQDSRVQGRGDMAARLHPEMQYREHSWISGTP
jgi:hypothetical protein